MYGEQGTSGEEAVVACFKISLNLTKGTEKKYTKPWLGQSALRQIRNVANVGRFVMGPTCCKPIIRAFVR